MPRGVAAEGQKSKKKKSVHKRIAHVRYSKLQWPSLQDGQRQRRTSWRTATAHQATRHSHRHTKYNGALCSTIDKSRQHDYGSSTTSLSFSYANKTKVNCCQWHWIKCPESRRKCPRGLQIFIGESAFVHKAKNCVHIVQAWTWHKRKKHTRFKSCNSLQCSSWCVFTSVNSIEVIK